MTLDSGLARVDPKEQYIYLMSALLLWVGVPLSIMYVDSTIRATANPFPFSGGDHANV